MRGDRRFAAKQAYHEYVGPPISWIDFWRQGNDPAFDHRFAKDHKRRQMREKANANES